jgi:hypothetical protein
VQQQPWQLFQAALLVHESYDSLEICHVPCLKTSATGNIFLNAFDHHIKLGVLRYSKHVLDVKLSTALTSYEFSKRQQQIVSNWKCTIFNALYLLLKGKY